MRDYEQNPRGHIWKIDQDGSIDIFGVEYGNHNGPICVNCEYSFCHHCEIGPKVDCSKAVK